jgi:phosphatidylglycerol:prolipoprotein diacylglycerol transferase
MPRHPSQLYEALLEGLVLFLILHFCWRVRSIRERGGMLSGIFLAGYGIGRIIGEFFRQPDAHLGFLYSGATMGQLLSIPMVLAGAGLILWASRRRPA